MGGPQRLGARHFLVEEKFNESTAIPPLPCDLDLAGCIVTLDAMGFQKNIAREIIEADAESVLALIGNHATIHAEVRTYLDPATLQAPGELVYTETVEENQDRLETRRYWQSEHLVWFAGRAPWEGLLNVGVVEAVRESKGQVQMSGATTATVSRSTRRASPSLSATTGASRINFTGARRCSSTGIRASPVAATRPQTSPPYAV